jgi:hypothetical protein
VNRAHQLAAFLLEDEGAWDFTTKIDRRNISVSGEDDLWYLQNAECVVEWHLDMDVRSWGLKEANPVIKSVRLRLEFEVDNEIEGGQNTEEVIEIVYPSQAQPAPAGEPGDVKAAAMRYGEHVSAEAQWAHREEFNVMIVPTEVEIDLRTNSIVVFF